MLGKTFISSLFANWIRYVFVTSGENHTEKSRWSWKERKSWAPIKKMRAATVPVAHWPPSNELCVRALATHKSLQSFLRDVLTQSVCVRGEQESAASSLIGLSRALNMPAPRMAEKGKDIFGSVDRLLFQLENSQTLFSNVDFRLKSRWVGAFAKWRRDVCVLNFHND